VATGARASTCVLAGFALGVTQFALEVFKESSTGTLQVTLAFIEDKVSFNRVAFSAEIRLLKTTTLAGVVAIKLNGHAIWNLVNL
jgi:hypothetical protein